MNFIKKYPISAREAAITPMIFRDAFTMDASIPYPSLKGIKDFTDYCGISYSAVRTALSRGHSDGTIRVFKDAGNVTRYQMVETQIDMGKTVSDRQNRAEGFIIAVFSFTKDEETERAKVRDALKYYGFKKLAQNTYINGMIETGGLKKTMREFGLEKNLYLFNCPNVDDEELIDKILSVFEVEKRNNLLREFQDDLAAFLAVEDLDIEEIIHRIYYLGPVHWNICYIDEPPFPSKYLPEDYPLNSIIRLFSDFSGKYMNRFIEHYIKINSQENKNE